MDVGACPTASSAARSVWDLGYEEAALVLVRRLEQRKSHVDPMPVLSMQARTAPGRLEEALGGPKEQVGLLRREGAGRHLLWNLVDTLPSEMMSSRASLFKKCDLPAAAYRDCKTQEPSGMQLAILQESDVLALMAVQLQLWVELWEGGAGRRKER